MNNLLLTSIIAFLAISKPLLGANSLSLDDYRPEERMSKNRTMTEVFNIASTTQSIELCKRLIRNEIDMCMGVQRDMVDQDEDFKIIISSLSGIKDKVESIKEKKAIIVQEIDDEKLKSKPNNQRLEDLYSKRNNLQDELKREQIKDLNQRQILFAPLPQYIEPYNLYKSYSVIIKDLESSYAVFEIVKNDHKLESMYVKNLISELASKSRRMERANTNKKHLFDSLCDAKYMYCDVHVTQNFIKTLIEILEIKCSELQEEEAVSGRAELYEREVRNSFLPSNLPNKNTRSKAKSKKKKGNGRPAKKESRKPQLFENHDENKPHVRGGEVITSVTETLPPRNEGKLVQEVLMQKEVSGVPVPIREEDVHAQAPLSPIQIDEVEPLTQKPWLKFSEKNRGGNVTKSLPAIDPKPAKNPCPILSEEAIFTAKILLGAGAEYAKLPLPMSQYKRLVGELNEGMVANANSGTVFLARSYLNHQIVKTVIHRIHGDKSDCIPRQTTHWHLAKTFLEDVGITKELLTK